MISTNEIFIPVPWGNICGKAYGNPEGRKVLVVHGWMDNCGTFDLLIPLIFSENLYFVCVDLPGHGQSSHLPAGGIYHNYEGVTIIRRIVNYLKWEKFDYIGHSMGAALGSLYASLFPTQVERMVMIDYAKFLSWENEEEINGYATNFKEFLAIDRQKAGQFPVTPYPLSKLCSLYVIGTNGGVNEEEAAILLDEYQFFLAAHGLCLSCCFKVTPIHPSLSLQKRGARQLEPGVDKWTLSRDPAVRNGGLVKPRTDDLLKIFESMRCHLLILKAKQSKWEESQEVCDKAFAIYKSNCKTFEYIEVSGNHFIPLTNPTAIAPHIIKTLIIN